MFHVLVCINFLAEILRYLLSVMYCPEKVIRLIHVLINLFFDLTNNFE